MRLRIVFIADLHVGHYLGLCSPEVPGSDDDSTYRASTFQKRLYERYVTCATGPWHRPDYVVVAGDAFDGQGRRQRGVEQWTTNVYRQIREAARLCRLWEPRRGFIVARGSDYHARLDGVPADEWFARELEALLLTELDPGVPAPKAEDGGDLRRSHQVVYLTCPTRAGGVTVQVAHSLGFTRVWQYRSTAITREMLMTRIEDRMRKQLSEYPTTTCVVRAHVHFCWHVESTSSHGIVVPAWQGLTPFMSRGSASVMPDVGFWGLTVEEEGYEWEKHAWSLDTVETPPVIAEAANSRRLRVRLTSTPRLAASSSPSMSRLRSRT